jgi:hypothetical protein
MKSVSLPLHDMLKRSAFHGLGTDIGIWNARQRHATRNQAVDNRFTLLADPFFAFTFGGVMLSSIPQYCPLPRWVAAAIQRAAWPHPVPARPPRSMNLAISE